MSSDANAALPANAALVSGSKSLSITFKTAGSSSVTVSDLTHASISAYTSPAISVGAGALSKLQILAPSETAAPGTVTGKSGTPTAQTAGNALAVTVNAVDANWNLVSGASDTVGITSSDANAVLPANAALVGGTKTFTLTFKTTPNGTVTATDITDGTKTANTTSVIPVNAGGFVKLQLLLPGESAAPGTSTGKTGTPTNPGPDTAFNITVRAVDDNWNLVNTATDVVAFTSSDIFASLPTNTPLAAGTGQFSMKLSEAGTTNTVTATDFTDSSKAPVTTPIAVMARYVSAAGGSAIPASNAGGVFTGLIGPIYSEAASGEVGKGTIVLNAPAGFIFDIGGVAPTVRIDRISATGKSPANINNTVSGSAAPMTSVSSTQVVFTVSTASSGATCKLTWQDVRVRPTASSPLASRKITKSGTSAMVGVTNGVSNLATLREILNAPALMAQAVPAPEASYSLLSPNYTADQSSSPSLKASLSNSSNSSYPATSATMTGITRVDSGIKIAFIGVPASTYEIERASELGESATWEVIGSVSTDSLGNGALIDSNPPALRAFYRTRQ